MGTACRLPVYRPIARDVLIIINNPVAILEDRWGASVLQLEQGGAGLVQVRVRSYNGEFCAVVGCGNRSDREEKISFLISLTSVDFPSK